MASDGSNNGMLYGIIGALCVAVVGGGIYMFKTSDKGPVTPPVVATQPAPVAPPVVAAPRPSPPVPATPAGPTAAQNEQVRQLVLDARRAITRADFASAERALDQAEGIDPRSSDVIAARQDLRDAQQRAARIDRRVDALVAMARAAIARRDYIAADRALDEAERIDRRDRDVLQARAELEAAQQRPEPRPGQLPRRD